HADDDARERLLDWARDDSNEPNPDGRHDEPDRQVRRTGLVRDGACQAIQSGPGGTVSWTIGIAPGGSDARSAGALVLARELCLLPSPGRQVEWVRRSLRRAAQEHEHVQCGAREGRARRAGSNASHAKEPDELAHVDSYARS